MALKGKLHYFSFIVHSFYQILISSWFWLSHLLMSCLCTFFYFTLTLKYLLHGRRLHGQNLLPWIIICLKIVSSWRCLFVPIPALLKSLCVCRAARLLGCPSFRMSVHLSPITFFSTSLCFGICIRSLTSAYDTAVFLSVSLCLPAHLCLTTLYSTPLCLGIYFDISVYATCAFCSGSSSPRELFAQGNHCPPKHSLLQRHFSPYTQ